MVESEKKCMSYLWKQFQPQSTSPQYFVSISENLCCVLDVVQMYVSADVFAARKST